MAVMSMSPDGSDWVLDIVSGDDERRMSDRPVGLL
jgi:hypothetical protein